jgi:NADH-quinone oxidoreductase subunit F
MLISGIPAYRLPRELLRKEINALIDENVTLKCDTALGRDMTIDSLFKEGYKAIFLAMGAHKSKALNIEGENLKGVYPAIDFLKSFNLLGKNLAKGRVGVIGGGDSAIDAARVSMRQKDVESVTILYRRTRQEMPALQHEISAAIEEGIELVTLVSPKKIISDYEILTGVECIKNKLGDVDQSGRRNPVPVAGSETVYNFDTLIVTIGDSPDVDYISYMGIEVNKWGTLITDEDTLTTNRKGVFAGGDVVTGPNTVIAAIADGKKAAIMIDRYLSGIDFKQPVKVNLPKIYVKPPEAITQEDESQAIRVKLPTISIENRKRGLEEVELTLTAEEATYESRRCLRCDLDFTYNKNKITEQIELQEDLEQKRGVLV